MTFLHICDCNLLSVASLWVANRYPSVAISTHQTINWPRWPRTTRRVASLSKCEDAINQSVGRASDKDTSSILNLKARNNNNSKNLLLRSFYYGDWRSVYCREVFTQVVERCLLLRGVYYSEVFAIEKCLLWSSVHCGEVFSMEKQQLKI